MIGNKTLEQIKFEFESVNSIDKKLFADEFWTQFSQEGGDDIHDL